MKFLLKIIDRLLFEKVDKSKNGKSANEKIFDGKKGLVDFDMMNPQNQTAKYLFMIHMLNEIIKRSLNSSLNPLIMQ